MSVLKYLFLDMRSLGAAFQFNYEEQHQSFVGEIKKLGVFDKINFIHTQKSHLHREKKYFDLSEQYCKNHDISDLMLSLSEYQYLQNMQSYFIEETLSESKIQEIKSSDWFKSLGGKWVDFQGYEQKDIIFSLMKHLFFFSQEKKKHIHVTLLTTDHLFSLLSLYLNELGQNDYFHFDFKRMIKNKDVILGYDEINNINQYIRHYWDVDIGEHYFQNKGFTDYQKLYNTIKLLKGLNHCKNKIKLPTEGFGIKKIELMIKEFFTLEHFLILYQDSNSKLKKYLTESDLALAIDIVKLNEIHDEIDKDFLFNQLRQQ